MNEPIRASYAEQARARKAAEAAAIGIDDPLISRLVETFYQRIQEDELLGPIFEEHVADWNPHLARMKDFWASITLESGRFNGSPMARHIAIGGLDKGHFDHWLTLWNRTVCEIAPEPTPAKLPDAGPRAQAAAHRCREWPDSPPPLPAP